MSWVATAIVASTVISAGVSYASSKKGASAAKKQGKEEARMEGLLTDEKVRRLDIDERTLRGETLAGYTGGGVLSMMPGMGDSNVMSGSPKSVLGEQAKEFAAEKSITKKAGASNVQQSLMGSRAVADQYRYSGYANVASSISSLLTSFGTGNIKFGG